VRLGVRRQGVDCPLKAGGGAFQVAGVLQVVALVVGGLGGCNRVLGGGAVASGGLPSQDFRSR
jgi:hypothetical protein